MADQLSCVADAHVRLGEFSLNAALHIAAGSTVALTGPNGAGKTTLLRVLAGVQPLDAGRVRLGDRVVDEPATATWIRPENRGVGFVFQDHRLFPTMSALENVAFGLRARGSRRAGARRLAEEWIDAVGMGDHSATTAADLSGGQSQRVSLARALAVSPRLLLLDEPFASVDDASRRAMVEVIRSLDVTTIVATHDREIVAALADRETRLADGEIA